ncbi:hypothetical protein C8R45DRAFT_1025760 [Mycena sanguinolenta]|nr:hypothetical protein C8R45DRAFT_1025760 [Mycena sanguinolenta]
MSTVAVLISPGKQDKIVRISSPIIRALDRFKSTAHPADRSWDDASYVRMRPRVGEDGDVEFERDRAGFRHIKLKTKIQTQNNELATVNERLTRQDGLIQSQNANIVNLQNKFAELLKKFEETEQENKRREQDDKRREDEEREYRARTAKQSEDHFVTTIELLRKHVESMTLVEEFEVVSRVIQAFNDKVFALGQLHGLTAAEKETLKDNGLGYFSDILAARDRIYASNVEQALKTVENILTPEQWALCRRLQRHRDTLRTTRNEFQHPRPDRLTAERWLSEIAPQYFAEYMELLDSKPLRLKTPTDTDTTDRRLFVDPGEYEGPDVQEEKMRILNLHLQTLREEQTKVGEKRQRFDQK